MLRAHDKEIENADDQDDWQEGYKGIHQHTLDGTLPLRHIGSREPQVCPRTGSCDSPSGGTNNEPSPHQEWFSNRLDGLGLLPHSDSQRGKAHRPPAKLANEGIQHRSVEPIKPQGINFVEFEGGLSHLKRHDSVDMNQGVVTNAAQQPVGDSRGAT